MVCFEASPQLPRVSLGTWLKIPVFHHFFQLIDEVKGRLLKHADVPEAGLATNMVKPQSATKIVGFCYL